MEDKLVARMLGGFFLEFNGKDIALGRNSNSKFLQLLQLVMLNADNGILKDEIMNCLYDQDMANSNNSFNNLLYQMRKQMVKAGLPDREYIVRKKGAFYISDTLDFSIDVVDFKKAISDARSAQTDKEKYFNYSKAFDCYKGRLLPDLSNEIWVIRKSIELESDYDECTRWLIDYLKKAESFEELCSICLIAEGFYPDKEYQIPHIEALIGLQNYEEAYRLYDKTTRYYSEELGIKPPDAILECYHEMSSKILYEPGEIIDIQNSLYSNRQQIDGEETGAYDCAYPSFIDCYHVLRRNMARSGRSVYLMLCTLVDYEGKMIQNQDKLSRRSDDLHEAISETLREGDVICKYSASQFLILLVGTSQEDCNIVYRRISAHFKEISGSRAEFKYQIISLAELPRNLVSFNERKKKKGIK